MKVILDTNVLLSNFLFKGKAAEVFDFAVRNTNLFISRWILNETEEKLLEKFKKPESTVREIMGLIREKFRLIDPQNETPTICRDPDDNQILRLAEYIGADFLVTGDKDLLVLEKFGATEILSPSAFLERVN